MIEPWHLPDRIIGSPPETDTVRDAAPPGDGAPSAPQFSMLADEVRELECRRMREALKVAGGVKLRAAELIGMPIRTFAWKLKHYGIDS